MDLEDFFTFGGGINLGDIGTSLLGAAGTYGLANLLGRPQESTVRHIQPPTPTTREEYAELLRFMSDPENIAARRAVELADLETRTGLQAIQAPIDLAFLEQFGPDRVIFGGDWPVCLLGASYAQWVAALKEVIASRPRRDQKKLLFDNAERLYRLS